MFGSEQPPTSMTSWLLTWAKRAPFEARPQKPHPLERRVKNTELEILSLRATCPEEVGWAVTPQPNHRCKKEGHRAQWVGLAGLRGNTHVQQSTGEALLLHSPRSPPPLISIALKLDQSIYILSSREKVYVQPRLCWTGCERGIRLHTAMTGSPTDASHKKLHTVSFPLQEET